MNEIYNLITLLEYNPPTDPLISVLYSDKDLLILDKPSGLLTVPGRRPEHKDCLENRARDIYPSALTVHRLDMDTSGLVIMGLTPHAQKHLSRQFETRVIQKTYIADIWGQPDHEQGHINLPLICDWPNRPKQKIDFQHGKSSETLWRVLDQKGDVTRVELTPLTGRSHQLRVHMMSIGHPILGDRFYAHDAALHASPRLCLHASSLTFFHPVHETLMTFSSICPF